MNPELKDTHQSFASLGITVAIENESFLNVFGDDQSDHTVFHDIQKCTLLLGERLGRKISQRYKAKFACYNVQNGFQFVPKRSTIGRPYLLVGNKYETLFLEVIRFRSLQIKLTSTMHSSAEIFRRIRMAGVGVSRTPC